MNSCNHEDLVELAQGELSPERASQVELHADECAECARELSWLRTERALFRKEQATPASHVWQGIERRLVIAREERRVRRQRWMQVGGASTFLAAAASVVLFLWGRGATVVTPSGGQASSTKPAQNEPERPDDRSVAPEAFDTLDAAEAQVATAIGRLERAYAREKDTLDPEEALRFDEELQRLKHLLSVEKSTARNDVWARRRVLRAYSTYMRTMQAMVLEVRK